MLITGDQLLFVLTLYVCVMGKMNREGMKGWPKESCLSSVNLQEKSITTAALWECSTPIKGEGEEYCHRQRRVQFTKREATEWM